jgi:uncharacterized protein DUF5709
MAGRRIRRRSTEDDEVPVAGDRPLGAFDRVTAREQREGESLNTRVAREIPDEVPEDPDGADRIGRIYEELEDFVDVTKELVADESDDVNGLTPEEAAMHIVELDNDDDEGLDDL